MPDIDIQITDNSGEILKELKKKTAAALEGVGIQAEGFAKRSTPVDLGTLRNSMTHAVRGDDVYIGTNIPYAAQTNMRLYTEMCIENQAKSVKET